MATTRARASGADPHHERDDLLLSLEEAADRPPAEVGGKARTLGRLLREGFTVPRGVVLTCTALEGAARDRADGDGPGSGPEGAEDPMGDLLEQAVGAVGPGPLAVRSSGASEDGREASFAGQFETVLGVVGLEELRTAVEECRAAAESEHVRAYAGSRSGDDRTDALGLALVIQRMVDADAAGVAFTADPRTGSPDAVVVEAVSGVGESLVSGRATPERWSARPGEAVREGGPEKVLEPEVAAEIGRVARRIEEALDGPQDVEWAVSDGRVHVLQARPITAGLEQVDPVPVEAEPPEEGFWFRDSAHFPRPFHPLFSSIYIPRYEEAVAGAFEEFGILVEGLQIREIGGWPYSRIVPPGGEEGPAPPSWLLWILSRVVPSMRDRMRRAREARERDLEATYVRRWWDEWRPELDDWIRRADAVDLASLDREALTRHYRNCVETFGRGLRIHFKLFPPFFLAVSDLVFFCRDELGWEKGKATGLLAGESGMSSEPGRALEELAAAARDDEAVRTILQDADADALERLRERAPGFARQVDAYQERYGLRTLHYDFGTPTFRERPEMVLGFLRSQLERDGEKGGRDDDPATLGGGGSDGPNRTAGRDGTREERVSGLREGLVREAREALADRPDERRRFETLLERAHRAYPVREDNEFFALSILGLLRYAAQEVGRRMVRAGHLERPGQVHFLRHAEAEEWLDEPRDLRETARRREGERRWALTHPGPASYGEDPGPPPDPSPLPDAGARVLRALLWTVDNDLQTEPPEAEGLAGIGASSGRYTGTVRVVRSEDEFDKVRGGDVLVCPITSPTWSVLFPSIGALVTDDGGLLSHPAIIAREFGIPAVLATGRATGELEDGQVVTVDGTTGRVEPR